MTNRMWGGRFASGPASIMEEINASIDFDRRLWREDIAGSEAHCKMLAAQGIISGPDAAAILNGLEQIRGEIETGRFNFSRALEDIHLNIESRLKEIIGPAAGRLHTARSRNDQVATDFRLFVRQATEALAAGLQELQRALACQALDHAATVMPGFTHLQTAQPVTFGHHLLAYVEMFGRDRGRLGDARRRLNECPLGAAALAGTSFAIDRHATAQALGFERPMRNSIDAVSDRDFVLEVLAAATIAAMHLSRLGEEVVLWCSPQFGFVRLSDSFTTGSSIMPQKRNPDAAELVRAKVGRILGAFTALTVVMKGLPMTYAKDMQEDKQPFFDAVDNLALAIAAMTGVVGDLRPDVERLKTAAGAGHATATDLADWLVSRLGMPFREAHHVTGRLVAEADRQGCTLGQLSLADLQAVEPLINAEIFDVLTVESSVRSRRSFGGTAPENVRKAAAAWLSELGSLGQTGSGAVEGDQTVLT
jgi:argininosuccinate lyase